MKIKTVIRDSFRDLAQDELSLLFRAQASVIANGGTLGLYDDMSFIIAYDVDAIAVLVGILACRPDGDDVWIQLAFTEANYRLQGVFRRMVEDLVAGCPRKAIGLGTKPANIAMRDAAESCGFKQRTIFLYREK